MIGNQADALAVEHAGADLAHGLDGNGSRDVVGEHQVQIALHELTGYDLVKAGMIRQNLLCHGHGTCHIIPLSWAPVHGALSINSVYLPSLARAV